MNDEQRKPGEFISVKVEIDPLADINRALLIDRLLQGVNTQDTSSSWSKSEFTLYSHTRARIRLLQRFGASHSLAEIDETIRLLVAKREGVLESTSDDTIILREGKADFNFDMLIGIIASSLSPDIMNVAKTLLSNLSTILSNEDFSFACKRVDVSLFRRMNTQDVLVFHSRFESKIIEVARTCLFWSLTRKELELRVALRRVVLDSKYVTELERESPESPPRRLQRD